MLKHLVLQQQCLRQAFLHLHKHLLHAIVLNYLSAYIRLAVLLLYCKAPYSTVIMALYKYRILLLLLQTVNAPTMPMTAHQAHL